jgi:hypothetical protein
MRPVSSGPMADGPTRIPAQLRSNGAGAPAPATVTLEDETFTVAPAAGMPLQVQYRDLAGLAVEGYAVRLDFVDGTTLTLAQLGQQLPGLVDRLREGRTRQRLADRLVRLPADPLQVVDAAWGGARGLCQLVVHPWGLVLVPYDTSREDLAVRRAEVGEVADDPTGGRVTIEAGDVRVVLMGLGGQVPRISGAIRGLRQAAEADAAAIVSSVLPTASLVLRRRLAGSLIDGQPMDRASLGSDWEEVRAAFEATGDMAASLASLATLAGGDAGWWLSVAPTRPAAPEPDPKAWFFTAFPGAVAMEVASTGAHATYLFATRGSDAAAVVGQVSEALVDLRFLREPIALPDDRLAAGGARDYRRTVAAIPSLRAARARFVGRVVHDDGWEAAVRDVLAFLAGPGAAGGTWPGRAAQESKVAAAGGAEPEPVDTAVEP